MKAWSATDKALMMVTHKTRIDYDEPVIEAHNEVRKTPIDTGLQRVVTHRIDVSPGATVRSYHDYFGSHVHYFNLLEAHSELSIDAHSIVETTDAICCGPGYDVDQRVWTQRLSEYLNWSPAVPFLADYQTVRNPVEIGLDADDFLDALRTLGSTFASRFRYDETTTDVHDSPEALFRAGGGVCQDLAHALLGVLRSASVPCRYVSGYVYDPVVDDEGDRVQGSSASHAWVQVWHPDLGWVGIEPTNDKLVDWQYVRIAIGRDYTDVQPLRGIFLGAPEQTLDVSVQIRRIG